ncbi:GNAT family N-acetyltransferase [Pseudoduganella namucuonensis]|nr:GNAT family N-acetyltransferase [Pseudoduganella namucuonensis]
MPAPQRQEPAIRALTADDLSGFFTYLNDHLKDNGLDGAPLFQPLPRRQEFPADKAAAFSKALEVPLHKPGWRRAWIATGHDGILGHIDLRARGEGGTAHRALLGMGVHRLARRQGLGRVLVASALAWARSATALEWIDLEVLSVNEPARALYRQCGFRQTGEIEDMFRIDGERLAYTLMSLKLAR